ncbi:kinase-regulated stress-responsive transcription factor skn7 [Tulasnella sp. 403]|nr:kinase-regulated stress-responsive transcription factor skn7 [Tulasnella sp. 403]
MASSHPPPQSHHHAQPLPTPNHLHHQPPYSQRTNLPPSYPPTASTAQNGTNGTHSISSRHLPPLSQSPSYGRHDTTLPPLSPFSQRPYPPAPSFPPSLSRQSSQHHNPPHSYHQQHQPAPPHYAPPSSAHPHNHWEQGTRHEPPPPQPHPSSQQHSQGQPPPRSDSSSNLNAARRKSGPPEREESQAAADPPPPPSQSVPREVEDGGPPASDFVKKLAKMLDDPSFAHVVCWGPKGDCFVVKDMTEFTKSILPRMFKHSNFASFVRQLNKYDFHKIKNADESYGDQSWTFHHPDFQRSNRDALENIKRKVPAQRKGGRGATATGPAVPGSPQDAAPGLSNADTTAAISTMQAQIDQLSRSNEDMSTQLTNLERNYQNVLNEMVAYQRAMATQDSLMQNLISYLLQLESGKTPTEGLGKVAELFGGAPRPPLSQLNGIHHVPGGMTYDGSASSIGSNATLVSGSSPELSPSEQSNRVREDTLRQIQELQRKRNASSASTTTISSNDVPAAATPQTAPFMTPLNPTASATAAQQSLSQSGRIFSEGQMVPRTSEEPVGEVPAGTVEPPPQEWAYPQPAEAAPEALGDPEAGPSNYAPNPNAGPGIMFTNNFLNTPHVRIRRQPSWAVPPRVLLVDDDQVSRKLFSKFLQVSGCTIDVAVDGIGAVNKMNLEKYDLVLMMLIATITQDIVMPKLDGVSATSLIRQFDRMTPIISMTSNSKPTDVVTYYSSGMNDILPKPFTREGLFSMLEKHLLHLSKPQAVEDPKVPHIGMAISDDQYPMLAGLLGMGGAVDGFGGLGSANLIMGDIGIKRSMDALDDERDSKRQRFEVVE